MKIIILGTGKIGTPLAKQLVSENHYVTVVDNNAERLFNLQEHLDIQTICGYASHPNILHKADAGTADLLIAVTDNDEVNIMACQIAHSLFQTPVKMARISAAQYLKTKKLFAPNNLAIDVLISPEQLITTYICRLIEHPDALQVLDFANKKVQLVAIRVQYSSPLVGHTITTLYQNMPTIDTKVVAIFRQNKFIIPKADSCIEVNDEIFFISARNNIRVVMSELCHLDIATKKVIIAGGGNIGARLAQSLEQSFKVKIIENKLPRVKSLAYQLTNTIVLYGDASDKRLLLDENIENTDVFCAATNRDEANILSAILAKRLGAKKVMALINNKTYADIVEGSNIDIVISPQLAVVSHLLTHVRKGNVANVYSVRYGAAEAIEVIANNTNGKSKVVGKKIRDIPLPTGSIIGAIVNDNLVTIGHNDVVVQEGDHVIMFLTNKKKIPEIENLFQPE